LGTEAFCTVVVHSDCITRADSCESYQLLLVEIVLGWIEEKFQIELSREYVIPKGIKTRGEVCALSIPRSKRPLIEEVDSF
jgi:hypothetical protein